MALTSSLTDCVCSQRYGSLPRDGRIAQQLRPRAEAATPALTAAERAMWEAQLHCDLTCYGRSTEKLRGPPPVSLTKPDDDLIAPETIRQERLDNARTRGSLAGWFDLHERTDYVDRKLDATIRERFGLDDDTLSDAQRLAMMQGGGGN